MLDLKEIRNDSKSLANNLARRGVEVNFNKIIQIDSKRRQLQSMVDKSRGEKNRVSKDIGLTKSNSEATEDLKNKMRELNRSLKNSESELSKLSSQLNGLLLDLPNLLHDSVPDGSDESSNKEVRLWGKPEIFDFKAKDHVALGQNLGMFDFTTAAKISGSRFVIIKNDLARLNRALIQFMLDVHTQENNYTEHYVPSIVKADALVGTGQLPRFGDDLFKIDGDNDFYLIPTAEVPLTNIAGDKIYNPEPPALRCTRSCRTSIRQCMS